MIQFNAPFRNFLVARTGRPYKAVVGSACLTFQVTQIEPHHFQYARVSRVGFPSLISRC